MRIDMRRGSMNEKVAVDVETCGVKSKTIRSNYVREPSLDYVLTLMITLLLLFFSYFLFRKAKKRQTTQGLKSRVTINLD